MKLLEREHMDASLSVVSNSWSGILGWFATVVGLAIVLSSAWPVVLGGAALVSVMAVRAYHASAAHARAIAEQLEAQEVAKLTFEHAVREMHVARGEQWQTMAAATAAMRAGVSPDVLQEIHDRVCKASSNGDDQT